MPTLSERLKSVHYLFLTGVLTAEEFALAKARVIESYVPDRPGQAEQASAPPAPARGTPPAAPKPLNPTVTGLGLALGASGAAAGGIVG